MRVTSASNYVKLEEGLKVNTQEIAKESASGSRTKTVGNSGIINGF